MKTFKGYEANIADTVEIVILMDIEKFEISRIRKIYSRFIKRHVTNESFKNEIKPNSTAIHVRRGDFLKNGWNLDIKFYEESLNI